MSNDHLHPIFRQILKPFMPPLDQGSSLVGEPVDTRHVEFDLEPGKPTADQQVAGSQLPAGKTIGSQTIEHSDKQTPLEEGDAHNGEHSRKIVTVHVFPPIPIRSMDWQAYFDGDEPNDDGQMLYGEGATEQEAIDDLLSQVE